MKIKNYKKGGKEWGGTIQRIYVDAETDQWNAIATWRTKGAFKRAQIQADSYEELIPAAKALVPATPAP